MFLSSPIRKCFKIFHTTWDPKKTILNIFATFFLLSYSKLLFVSISLLLAVQSYNCEGTMNSMILLFDPSISFFSLKHIPYAILAILVIFVFVLPPPLLLLFYPTRLFMKCLKLLGFRRWVLLHHTMDIFQGWYKDGTEGTRDYRSLSSLYMLLRIGFSCVFIARITPESYYIDHDRMLWESAAVGIFHVLLGTLFLITKPYRKIWMNRADGLIFTLVGVLVLVQISANKPVYILEAVTGLSMMLFIGLFAVYKCVKENKNLM